MTTRLSAEELLKITNCKGFNSISFFNLKNKLFANPLVNRQEIEALSLIFTDMATTNDKMDRSRFRDMLADQFGVDDSLIMDRDADNYIGFDEFMKGMSVFLKGRYEEKLKFCFRVYDLNGDRYISKEEMYQMLKFCLVRGAEEDEDGIKDLVDLVLKKLDEDRDGRVSETDWAGAIAKESLLMEAFGQCLPCARDVDRFLNPNAVEEIDEGSNLSLNQAVGYAAYTALRVPPRKQKGYSHSAGLIKT